MSTSIPQQKNIVLDYSPGDFFYLSSNKTPDDETCQSFASSPPDCSKVSAGQNVSICMQNALCQNKALVQQLYNKQSVHSGADVKWHDLNAQYSREMLKTLNLLIGIVVSGVFIYYNRPSLSE